MSGARFSVRVGVVRGIDFGRFQMRLGIDDPAVSERVEGFLYARIRSEDVELLKRIRSDGAEALIRAYNEAISGKDDTRPLGKPERLSEALTAWIEGKPLNKHRQPLGEATVRTYREAIGALCRAADPGSTVHAVPEALDAYLAYCEKHDQNFPYRHAKAMLACYARNTGNEWVAEQVRKAPTMHNQRKRDRRSIEPKEVRRIMKRMEANGYGFLTQHVWNLACLGTRPKEYCQANPETPNQLEWQEQAVHVKKGKTRNARRFIPRLPGVKPAPNTLCLATGRIGRVAPGEEGKQQFYALNTLRVQFTKACNGRYQLYDLRASALKWWEWAGVSERAVQAFAGHSHSVSQGYRTNGSEFRDWKRDILTAQRKMRRWFERNKVIKPNPKEERERLAKMRARLDQQILKLSA